MNECCGDVGCSAADVPPLRRSMRLALAKRAVVVIVLSALVVAVWKIRQAPTPSPAPESTKLPMYQKVGVEHEGVEPTGDPVFDVTVEVRQENVRTVLSFYITERHGWYADELFLEFWYEEPDDGGGRSVDVRPVRLLCQNYLDFNSTLVQESTLMERDFPSLADRDPAELIRNVDRWKARISSWRRVLARPTP